MRPNKQDCITATSAGYIPTYYSLTFNQYIRLKASYFRPTKKTNTALLIEISLKYCNRPNWATVCKTVRPMLSVCCPVCLSCPSVCDVGVLWPNGWTDQDETWHAGRPRPWPHCVRWGPTSPSLKGAQPPPISGPYLLRPNGCMDQGATWYGARPQPRRLCVR